MCVSMMIDSDYKSSKNQFTDTQCGAMRKKNRMSQKITTKNTVHDK